jgi:alpha-tubulin suppressor-like RCC1 family protein
MNRVSALAALVAMAACGGSAQSTPSQTPSAAPPAAAAPHDPESPVHIASGDFHTCALRADGTVRCWGRNKEGQLGDGTTETRTKPTTVAGVSDVTQLALGANFSCALRRDGSVLCWGAGKAWGDGQTRSNVPPTPVAGLRGAAQIDAGGLLVCAVLAGGTVRCWGNEGDTSAPGATSLPAHDAEEVTVGEAHACARMKDGTVRCWGDSPWNGTGGPSLASPRVAGATRVTTGDAMACALAGGEGVTCWGRNDQGELGRSPDNDWHAQPQRVVVPATCSAAGQEGRVTGVTAGESHVCAVVVGGCVSCWGSNGDGELGRGSQGRPESPGAVPGLEGVEELALGADHACARTRASAGTGGGTIWCWGSNAQGQLGDGTTERRTTPTRVAW